MTTQRPCSWFQVYQALQQQGIPLHTVGSTLPVNLLAKEALSLLWPASPPLADKTLQRLLRIYALAFLLTNDHPQTQRFLQHSVLSGRSPLDWVCTQEHQPRNTNRVIHFISALLHGVYL